MRRYLLAALLFGQPVSSHISQWQYGNRLASFLADRPQFEDMTLLVMEVLPGN